jgi:hypothetical protein
VAPSSSAKKVAKLASRGKGKKVRFSSGTTFPTVVGAVLIAMIGLITYAKLTVPGIETGPPQPSDLWSMAYGIRICDTYLPHIEGTSSELTKDASTGDETAVQSGPDGDGIIHYHAQAGGNTGRKAKLSVFLDIYGIKLSTKKLVVPAQLVGEGEPNSWDVDDTNVFKGTPCEGKKADITVRVWNDYTTGAFEDKVTDFGNQRFTRSGMIFVIAVVPVGDDPDIPKPSHFCQLEDLGVVGSGDSCHTGSTATTVAPTDSTVLTTDTTVATTDTTANTTADTAATTTTSG